MLTWLLYIPQKCTNESAGFQIIIICNDYINIPSQKPSRTFIIGPGCKTPVEDLVGDFVEPSLKTLLTTLLKTASSAMSRGIQNYSKSRGIWHHWTLFNVFWSFNIIQDYSRSGRRSSAPACLSHELFNGVSPLPTKCLTFDHAAETISSDFKRIDCFES